MRNKIYLTLCSEDDRMMLQKGIFIVTISEKGKKINKIIYKINEKTVQNAL
jgi:hypothetical protein